MKVIQGKVQTKADCCWWCRDKILCAALTRCLRKEPLTADEKALHEEIKHRR